MQVVIGGASGFLGSALSRHLQDRGHHVTRLVRGGGSSAHTSEWDPAAGRIDQVVIDRADVVVNLSGAPISKWPRTASVRREILHSRVSATRTLADAIAASPEPAALISGSGMSWYGTDRGADVLDESSSTGAGFLADVSREWEAAASPVADAGARVCFVRTSLVLDASGGVLKLMRPVWKLGGGARLGSGQQWMSLISLHDWVRGVTFLVETPETSGPFNFATPSDQTNADYTRALGDAVHRPTFLVAPTFAVRAVLGGLADDLLGSLRLSPAALQDAGFEFDDPDLASVLESALR